MITELERSSTIASPLLTTEETMSYLRLSRPTVQRHVASGRLKKIKLGSRVLFHFEDIEAFVCAGRVQ